MILKYFPGTNTRNEAEQYSYNSLRNRMILSLNILVDNILMKNVCYSMAVISILELLVLSRPLCSEITRNYEGESLFEKP